MLIDFDETNFLDEVVVAYSIKKILDSTHYRSSECVIRIDVDDVAISEDRELTI